MSTILFNGKNVEKIFAKANLQEILSVNDLKEKQFRGLELADGEKTAILNFERYRLEELKNQRSEKDFHTKFNQLRIIANLLPYEHFL